MLPCGCVADRTIGAGTYAALTAESQGALWPCRAIRNRSWEFMSMNRYSTLWTRFAFRQGCNDNGATLSILTCSDSTAVCWMSHDHSNKRCVLLCPDRLNLKVQQRSQMCSYLINRVYAYESLKYFNKHCSYMYTVADGKPGRFEKHWAFIAVFTDDALQKIQPTKRIILRELIHLMNADIRL